MIRAHSSGRGAVSRHDPDYLALKARGERPVKCTANQLVMLMGHVFERDEEIADLKRRLAAHGEIIR